MIYDLFIDLFHVVSQYISQFTVALERNNAVTSDDYVGKTFDRILTCMALPHIESDASDSEADSNKPYIIFCKSS